MPRPPKHKLPAGSFDWIQDPKTKEYKAGFRRPSGKLTTNERERERRLPELGIRLPSNPRRFFTLKELGARGYELGARDYYAMGNGPFYIVAERRGVRKFPTRIKVMPLPKDAPEMKLLPPIPERMEYYYFVERRFGPDKRKNK